MTSQSATASFVRDFYASLAGANDRPLDHFLAADAVMDVPGDSPNAGRYRGLAEIGGFLLKAMQTTRGTLKLTLHDVAVGDDHVVAVTTYTASRPGRAPLENHLCHLLKLRDGRIAYSRFFTGDQYKTDAFWRD